MTRKYLSLRQFSKMAGVSPATVSHVFSNPSTVAESTVKRVRTLAEQEGFSPSVVARAAFGERTRSIGILLSHWSEDLADAMQETLFRADYLPITLLLNRPAGPALDRMLRHNVDGLILGFSDERLDVSAICEKQMRRLPVVKLEIQRTGLWGDSVLNNDYEAGQKAADHLLDLGHRHFGVVRHGEDLLSNGIRRLRGFRERLEARGGFFDDRFLLGKFVPGQDEITELQKVLRRKDRPTAFFCTTDYKAMYLLEAAKREGLRVPDDFSVIGFGDLPFAPYLTPALTTFHQDFRMLGQQAAELILRRIREPERPEENVTVDTVFTERESCRKL